MKALLDRQHIAPGRAHAWLAQNLATGWASCPLTENGCLRVLTNPRHVAPVRILINEANWLKKEVTLGCFCRWGYCGFRYGFCWW